MKIRFIGTCAHDYSPLLQSVYKEKLGKDARRSSSMLVNGHVLIDCGDHVPESLQIQGIAFGDVDILLLTHLHGDHYCPDHIREIAGSADRKLQVFAHRCAMKYLKRDLDGANVEIHALSYCKSRKVCGGLKVTALPANHTACPSHYLIEDREKCVYYGTDGAWIMYDTFYYLLKKKLDVCILDATVGDYEGDIRVAEHNSIPMIRMMLKSLYDVAICNENTRVILSHIAPSLHECHEKERLCLAEEKLELAYDGLEIVL